MKKRERVNVTCRNPACTKPLFSIVPKGKGVALESFGASIRAKPIRLGVDEMHAALCPHCGTETDFKFPM